MHVHLCVDVVQEHEVGGGLERPKVKRGKAGRLRFAPDQEVELMRLLAHPHRRPIVAW